MIRIVYNDGSVEDYGDLEYIRDSSGNQAENTVKVIASNKWLERIKRHFENIPKIQLGMSEAAVAWYGSDAMFITGNIVDLCDAHWDHWMSTEG